MSGGPDAAVDSLDSGYAASSDGGAAVDGTITGRDAAAGSSRDSAAADGASFDAARPLPSAVCATPLGHGAAVTGGTGGSVIEVDDAAALRAALAATGARIVRLTADGTYDLGGKVLISNGDLTLERAAGATGVIRGWFVVQASNVIFDNLAIRPDDGSDADDVDPISLNGLRDPIYGIVIMRSTLTWGADIGGLSMLGDVNEVTIQCSIIGEGLRLSRHAEGYVGDGQDGHSMGFSIFQLRTEVNWANDITIWGNLITTSDRRMPVIHGAEGVDLLNNVIYNWGRNPPDGNPRGINVVGNVMKRGPNTESDSLIVWRSRPHSANPCCYASSVYLDDNLAVGFDYGVESSPEYLRSTPAHPYSVAPMPASDVEAFVAANAGPLMRDVEDQRLVDNMIAADVGPYYNSAGHPAPNPSWP